MVYQIGGFPDILLSTFEIPERWLKDLPLWQWEMVTEQNFAPYTLPSTKAAPFVYQPFSKTSLRESVHYLKKKENLGVPPPKHSSSIFVSSLHST